MFQCYLKDKQKQLLLCCVGQTFYRYKNIVQVQTLITHSFLNAGKNDLLGLFIYLETIRKDQES